jgi:hypothetical protein
MLCGDVIESELSVDRVQWLDFVTTMTDIYVP